MSNDQPARRLAIAISYGVLCHSLFIIAVATMIGMMFFGMSHSIGDLARPWNFVGNTFLLLQFPFAHSLLLTRGGNAFLRHLAPAAYGSGLTTTTYATVASIQVLALFLLWSPSGTVWWQAEGPLFVLVCCCYALAWFLLFKAIVDAGFALQVGLLGWYSLARDVAVRYPLMPQSGLFRLCRQPIYVAFSLTLWTVPVWTPDQLVIAIVLTAYCLIGPAFKEARFRLRYGGEFDAYQRRVPYWFPWGAKMNRNPNSHRNDLSIYDAYADLWWTGKERWLRVLQNIVPARLDYFTRVVSDWRGKAVLDLGCGGGFMSEALARRGAQVIGIDPSAPAIAIARKHSEASGLAIDYRPGVGERLPVVQNSLDIVVCVDVLEHVADLDRVIDEIRRVLKPGGLFLFDTINRNWLAVLVMITFGETLLRLLPPGTHDPNLFIKPAELRDRLEHRGFAVAPFSGFGPHGLDRRFDFTFGPSLTTAIMYIGHARSADSQASSAICDCSSQAQSAAFQDLRPPPPGLSARNSDFASTWRRMEAFAASRNAPISPPCG